MAIAWTWRGPASPAPSLRPAPRASGRLDRRGHAGAPPGDLDEIARAVGTERGRRGPGLAAVAEGVGIHHITAIAGDPDRNLRFYARALGLRLVKLTVNYDDPATYHFYFGDERGRPGTILTFFPWPQGSPGRLGTGQVAAIGFAIPPASLGFWIERLIAQASAIGARVAGSMSRSSASPIRRAANRADRDERVAASPDGPTGRCPRAQRSAGCTAPPSGRMARRDGGAARPVSSAFGAAPRRERRPPSSGRRGPRDAGGSAACTPGSGGARAGSARSITSPSALPIPPTSSPGAMRSRRRGTR